jgi:phosphatidylserine/phosphatidylglycerophosphate/cardiolipin synthase-like enzyme
MQIVLKFRSFFLASACLGLYACAGIRGEAGAPAASRSSTSLSAVTEEARGPGRVVHGSWYDLYFTDPGHPLARQESGGPAAALAAAIDEARLTVDVAAYRLDLYSFRIALLRAHDRGLRVRLVLEGDELESPDAQALLRAGIPVAVDGPDGLMHNKFVVLDGGEVWTGSMNFTDSGAYSDHNNLLRLLSTQLGEDYTREFEEMFREGSFGPHIGAETPHPRVTLPDAQIDVLFSPDDGVAAHLARLISNASESIDFLAFSFTSDLLGEAVRGRGRAGIAVRGVMDADQARSNLGTEYDSFLRAGLPVRLDGWSGQMHHKVLIIDQEILITGSYNLSNSAEERNDENLLVIYDHGIAANYLAEFQRIFEAAPP